MSIENVKKFYVSVSKDAKLMETLGKINEEIKQKNLAPEEFYNLVNSKIIPLAKERGFDFTADELMAYSKEMIKGLSEEDLAAVSGGMSPRTSAVALAFTLGSSFLAAGVVNMMSNTPTQNQAIMSSSTSNDEKKADRHAIPKLMKDENEEPNTEAKTQDISKDMQEALKDKKIVLPGQEAENSEAAPSAEEINAMIDAIENNGAATVVRNEIKESKESKNEVKEEKSSSPAVRKATATPASSHVEDAEIPLVKATSAVVAGGTEGEAEAATSAITGTPESEHEAEIPITYGDKGDDAEAASGDIDLTKTTKEELQKFINNAKKQIETDIENNFNVVVRERGGKPLVSEELTDFAKTETEKSEDLDKITITRDGIKNIVTLSAKGTVPGWISSTKEVTVTATINVYEFVKQLNNKAIDALKEVETKKVNDEVEAMKKVITNSFKDGLASRSGVEYASFELDGVITNLKSMCKEAYDKAKAENKATFEGVVSESGILTVRSVASPLVNVQVTLNLDDLIKELNAQEREARIKTGTEKLEFKSTLADKNLKGKLTQYFNEILNQKIDEEVLRVYNEKNPDKKAEVLGNVPEGDQRRIKLEIAKSDSDLLKKLLESRTENKDDTVIIETRIPSTNNKFLTVAAKDKNGNVITHTEEIDMEAELQSRLLADTKIHYIGFGKITATYQANTLLKTLNDIESLDEIENVDAIKADIEHLAKQMVIKADNYTKEKHIKPDVLEDNIELKSKDIKAIGNDGKVIVTKDAPLVLSGFIKYGRGVPSKDLHKILDFYEQSLS